MYFKILLKGFILEISTITNKILSGNLRNTFLSYLLCKLLLANYLGNL